MDGKSENKKDMVIHNILDNLILLCLWCLYAGVLEQYRLRDSGARMSL